LGRRPCLRFSKVTYQVGGISLRLSVPVSSSEAGEARSRAQLLT
jgi:hypothetical protein